MFDQIRIQDVLSEINDIYLVNFPCVNLPQLQGALIGIFIENVIARWSDSPLETFGQSALEKVSLIHMTSNVWP